jgi:hypothetical protein
MHMYWSAGVAWAAVHAGESDAVAFCMLAT